MQSAEIRRKFLDFFERHGHTKVESSSLVPSNDPTLLFTNAGMVPFKDVFLGKDERSYKKATSCQKCVRAGGKHNDLENVGYTARHHTFFEMLGNFSFGDYFKKEAIRFAWQFVTQELKLPVDKLYITVFEDDEEAADIWHRQEGVPKERIIPMGEKDNFWQMGDTGPCGPCSEIFIDRGPGRGACPDPQNCKVGCECDRFIEFWNLVFMQFDRSSDGTMTPLPRPSVDTGAGLERLAAILQDVDSNYLTDGFRAIIEHIARLAHQTYSFESELAVSFHVLADHARAATFLIGDGVIPSNEGRGYVLRRIIRRAVRHGKKLGFTNPFLFKVCQFVVDQMKEAYPELSDKNAFISKLVQSEEEQFLRTLEKGLELLDESIASVAKGGSISGEVAFKLYDTYGFPLDLTKVVAGEHGVDVDEEGFAACMQKQRAQSRQNWQGSGEQVIDDIYQKVVQRLRNESQLPQFVGYETETAKASCLALLHKPAGGALREVTSVANPGEDDVVEAVFSETPFYGESGGQVGDHGKVFSPESEAIVLDVQRPASELITVKLRLLRGSMQVGNVYDQVVDTRRRALIKRNHTATHLLHAALRQVLGDHVKQAGSLVSSDLLRFDFTHFSSLTADELYRVEELVCQQIWEDHPVEAKWLDKDEAMASGAIAFFGEKYGEKVRVLSCGDFSTELCGGTHVSRTGEIQLFKILSEGAIASGVRRMVALTSQKAFEYLRDRDNELRQVRNVLKSANAEETHSKLVKMLDTERQLRKQLDDVAADQVRQQVEALARSAETVGDHQMVIAQCEADPQGIKRLREISDRLAEKLPDAVAVLGMAVPEQSKAFILVAVGKGARAKVKAQELVRDVAPVIDGKGGGKPEMAQAGGTKPESLGDALRKAADFIRSKL